MECARVFRPRSAVGAVVVTACVVVGHLWKRRRPPPPDSEPILVMTKCPDHDRVWEMLDHLMETVLGLRVRMIDVERSINL